MGYLNPLLDLPAAKQLMALPPEQRKPMEALLRELREHANKEAEKAWLRRKSPMAVYWRACSTYCRHFAHVLATPERIAASGEESTPGAEPLVAAESAR